MRTRTGEPLNLLRSSPKDLLANEGANSNDSRGAQAMRGGSETECERNDVLLGSGEHQAKYSRFARERVVWTLQEAVSSNANAF